METVFRIKGRVQGVGYRFWAIRKIKEIGNLSGYIHNYFDGDVLVYLSGNKDNIEKAKILFYKGPFLSRVDSVEEHLEDIKLFPPIENGIFKKI